MPIGKPHKKFATGDVIGDFSSSAKFAVSGIGSTVQSRPKTSIIANGENMIIRYNSPGVSKSTYFCLKNVYLKDFNFAVTSDDIPSGSIRFNFFNTESKSFKIPDHIPEEQHVSYIKEQFNFD